MVVIGVLIIPTGIGAEIGGHAGDANPVAKLLGACLDTVILHPNVVNGSDMNEMPENGLYVEGSILDRFLCGSIGLKRVRHQNRILVVTNGQATPDTVNAVNAARVTVGVSAEIFELTVPLVMKAVMGAQGATGDVTGWRELVAEIARLDFDALAIHTPVDVHRDVALRYFRVGGINPWGGVEAVASKLISGALDKPVAHAPIETITNKSDPELFNVTGQVVDPRIAPEAISQCYLNCVLKGLNRAPRVTTDGGLRVEDVDVLVSPHGCFGPPHQACLDAGVPIIVVKENQTVLKEDVPGAVTVENYWEAAGLLMAMRAGIDPLTVRNITP